MTSILLALALAASASAQEAASEKLDLLGWSKNKSCSVALAHYGYPHLGEAVVADPVLTRIGTLTILPGNEDERVSWVIDWKGAQTWRPLDAEKVKSALKKAGYTAAGFKETLRPDPVVDQRDLPRLILSTDTMRTRSPGPWPGSGWRWAQAYYSPLSTCALLVYAKKVSEQEHFNYLLVRVENPAARPDRALAHVTNGLLLLEKSDAAGALEENGIAAAMAPGYAPARYHYGALLSLAGRDEEALRELSASIALDPKYKQKARQDRDYESLRRDRRFRELTSR